MIGPIDFVLLAIWAIVAWCVSGEGAYSAAFTCLSVILAGLLAMNYFEPVANMLPTTGWWRYGADIVSLVGLFTAFVFGLRYLTEYLCPRFIQLPPLAYELGRWGCGILTGYVTMAFLLTALHTAPLPREFLGFRPERANLLSIAAPDRQWLGFTQYVSEHIFRRGPGGRIFDGPRIALGDPSRPYPNEIWPSFPIRYATRREALSGGVVATSAPNTGRRRIQTRRRAEGGGF